MADSADLNYTTFCPHCEASLPPRTFRYHRERFYDEVNDVWEKRNGDSSDEDVGEIGCNWGSSNQYDSDEPDIDDVNARDDLLYHEVWDDTQRAEIDEDFLEQNETPPSVDVQTTNSGLVHPLNRAFTHCFVIFLAYFWTCFCISDNGMEFLLSGLKRLFDLFGESSNWFAGIAFPGSLYCFKKQLGPGKDKFKKYVMCPKCHSLYEFEDCYHTVGSCNKSKTCSFVKFTNHRQPWRRRPCGETLLKEVTLKDGSKRLYMHPHKIYCYQSLIESIKRPNFVDRCELWRSREVRSVGQILGDVFDGRAYGEIFRLTRVYRF